MQLRIRCVRYFSTPGTVDAFSSLCCEVVFHPSFFAPLDGEFALRVDGGITQKLHCHAKVPYFLFKFTRLLVLIKL
jgi:hypothetical protein